jgi:cytoskeletal protein CcmA (bactofilin family)
MLDNFRRKDNSQPGVPRAYSPFNEMQEALSPGAVASPRPEALKPEPPKPNGQDKPSPSRPGDGSVSKLIVGPDIKLKGAEITDCDTLVVEGRVEASMDSRVIQISEHGVFLGKVGIDVAEIRGRFEGELTARKQLIVRASGKVSGTIRYGKLTIEEGGELSGDVATLAPVKGAGAAHAVASEERKQAAGATPGAQPTVPAGALFARPSPPPR